MQQLLATDLIRGFQLSTIKIDAGVRALHPGISVHLGKTICQRGSSELCRYVELFGSRIVGCEMFFGSKDQICISSKCCKMQFGPQCMASEPQGLFRCKVGAPTCNILLFVSFCPVWSEKKLAAKVDDGALQVPDAEI